MFMFAAYFQTYSKYARLNHFSAGYGLNEHELQISYGAHQKNMGYHHKLLQEAKLLMS